MGRGVVPLVWLHITTLTWVWERGRLPPCKATALSAAWQPISLPWKGGFLHFFV